METTGDFIQHMIEEPRIAYFATRDVDHSVFSTIVFIYAVADKIILHIPETLLHEARNNLLVSDYAAVLLVDVRTYRSLQVKGRAAIRAASDTERRDAAAAMSRLSIFYGLDLQSKKKPLLMILCCRLTLFKNLKAFIIVFINLGASYFTKVGVGADSTQPAHRGRLCVFLTYIFSDKKWCYLVYDTNVQ